jgi:hypothetical protein
LKGKGLKVNDAEYLASDQGSIREVAVPTPRERYRAALAQRTALENQVARLQRQLDPVTHQSADPIDVARRVQMARELLGPACQRLRDAIERCIVLRPAAQQQPRPRREPQPVVRLETPSRSRTASDYRGMSMQQITRDWSIEDWRQFARSKDRYEQRNLGYMTRDLRHG